MKRLSFRNNIKYSFIFHTFISALIVVIGIIHSPSNHELQIHTSIDSTTASDQEIVKSVQVSQEYLDSEVKKYISDNQRRESELTAAKMELASVRNQLNKSKEDLSIENENLNKFRNKIDNLKIEAKRIETENQKKKQLQNKLAYLESEADDLERKTKRIEKLNTQRRLLHDKNMEIVKSIQRSNELIASKQKEELRSKYEAKIHNILYAAWKLPFNRTNVTCSVILNLATDGRINGHKYNDGCPDNYREMIDLALERVGRLPQVDKIIFRDKEVVNFIDQI